MKNFLIWISAVIHICHLSAQPVLFTQSSDLIHPVTGFTAYSDCIVDMNGDYLDDVVRVGGKGLFIDYQQKDGLFIQRQFNFPLQSLPSWSICAGDIDNNGYNDLLFAHSSSVSFIKANSNGTSFAEDLMPDSIESQRSTIADINNDGWLDAFVCHESGESKPYRNQGQGMMMPDAGLIPTSDLVGNYAAIWTDFDNDKDIDLYITKCWESALPGDPVRTNLLYRSNNDGTFTEIGEQAGLDDNAQGWSTAVEDFDNDGDFDFFIINHDFANRLMRNNNDGTFTDVILDSGIDPFDLEAYEAASGDFNNDGFIDIFSDLTLSLYLGNGDLTFTGQDAPMTPGAIGDLNEDGSLDVIQDNKIWMNEGNPNHWIKINTIGTVSNRNGIGARIEIYGAWGKQIREVRSGQAYSPMNSLTTHFGLGLADHVDSLIVIWPSGIETQLNNIKSDTTYFIPEASCLLPSISLDVEGTIKLCSFESTPLQGPSGFSHYNWSNGDTSQFIVVSKEGVYFLIVTDSSGCMSMSRLVQVEMLEDHPPTIVAETGVRFCEGDTVTLTSSPGENYRWSTGEILLQSIKVTEGGEYTVAVDAICFDGQISSAPVQLTLLQAPPPVVSDVFVFPGDSVLLVASGTGIHWYDQPEGGNLLATGTTFQTSALDADVTYFLESHHFYPSEMQSGGKTDTTGEGGMPLQDGNLRFDVWEPFILNSVTVYIPEGGPQGVRFIQLYSNDSLIASRQFNVLEGLNVLDLDFYIPVGNCVLATPQGNLYRNTGTLNYPYPIGDAGQITGSSNGENYYYYFYDWKITKPGIECVSERIPVNLIVTSDGTAGKAANEIIIYPNPASDILYIQFKEELIPVEVVIADLHGREIFRKIVREQNYHLNIGQYSSGIYQIQCIRSDLVFSGKILIE